MSSDEKVKLSKEEEERVTAAVVALAKAVMVVQAYREESPLAKESINNCYKLLSELIQAREEFIIYTSEGKIKFKEIALAERHPLVKRLAKKFGKDHIISLGFDSGMSQSDLIGLLKILATRSDDILEAGGLEKQLEKLGVGNIKINPVTYELVREEEEITEKEEEKEEGEKIEKQVIEGEVGGGGYKEKIVDGESRFADEDLAAKRKPKIVIIDDDKDLLISLEKTLKNEGYAVATSHSVNRGLELLRGAEVDLVICNHKMPEIDGIRTLELVARDYPNALKILMTSNPDMNMMAEAIKRVTLYRLIFKPWDTQEMKGTLKFAFKQKKLIIADELLSQEMKRREAALRDSMR